MNLLLWVHVFGLLHPVHSGEGASLGLLGWARLARSIGHAMIMTSALLSCWGQQLGVWDDWGIYATLDILESSSSCRV